MGTEVPVLIIKVLWCKDLSFLILPVEPETSMQLRAPVTSSSQKHRQAARRLRTGTIGGRDCLVRISLEEMARTEP
jgi:hypothetical protein